MIHVSSFVLPFARLRLLFCLLGFIAFLLLFPHPTFAAVVINEIFPKPSNETGEWIELYNNGPDPVSVEGWRLENAAGDKKTFIVESGISIPAHKFWSFDQAQTLISLYNEGDTVKLFKPSGEGWEQLDSQGYSGTLGVNNSVGRSSDGDGIWATCTSWTKNLPNNCPPPPTSAPTTAPTYPPVVVPTVTPVDTPTPIPTATITASVSLPPSRVPATPIFSSPRTEKGVLYADMKQFILRWTLGVVSLCIAVVAILILLVNLYQKHKRNRENSN